MTPIDKAEKKKAPREVDVLKKRHCWPKDSISDIYEYGFEDGWNAALESEQRIKERLASIGLVEAIKNIEQLKYKDFDDYYNEVSEIAEDALEKYRASLKPPQAHDESTDEG